MACGGTLDERPRPPWEASISTVRPLQYEEPPSVVVLATADGAAHGAQDPQDRSNHQQDDANGHQDGNAGDQSHDHKHNSENDHLGFLSALRGQVRVSLEHLARTNLSDRLVGALHILVRSLTGETLMACGPGNLEMSTNPMKENG